MVNGAVVDTESKSGLIQFGSNNDTSIKMSDNDDGCQVRAASNDNRHIEGMGNRKRDCIRINGGYPFWMAGILTRRKYRYGYFKATKMIIR